MEFVFDTYKDGYKCSIFIRGVWVCTASGMTKDKAKQHALRLFNGVI